MKVARVIAEQGDDEIMRFLQEDDEQWQRKAEAAANARHLQFQAEADERRIRAEAEADERRIRAEGAADERRTLAEITHIRHDATIAEEHARVAAEAALAATQREQEQRQTATQVLRTRATGMVVQGAIAIGERIASNPDVQTWAGTKANTWFGRAKNKVCIIC